MLEHKTAKQPQLSHIAVIMDGNGRWATKQHLPRTMGHKKGAERVREIIEAAIHNKISYLTLYAFSAENWNRPAHEVESLMDLLNFYLNKELNNLHGNGVKLLFVGEKSKLSPDINKRLDEAEKLTKDNLRLTLTIALSYGSRHEIINAAKLLAEDFKKNNIDLTNVDENYFSKLLYTSDIPNPDLLIRTGGEKRLSNFLLWQSAYTELYFSDTLWPDFSKKHLEEAILEFSKRDRRYGSF